MYRIYIMLYEDTIIASCVNPTLNETAFDTDIYYSMRFPMK